MRVSADNQLLGTIVSLSYGGVKGMVRIHIGGGNVITSSITEEAVAELGLAEDDEVIVLFNASDVLIGK